MMTMRLSILTACLVLFAGCDQLPALKPSAPKSLDTIDAPKESKDFIKARATHSAGLKRNALLHFSLVGCGPCVRLDEEVLAKQEWRDFARANLIETLVEFPTTITSDDTDLVMKMQAMEGIATQLKKDAAFPFLVILGRDGAILGGRSGYMAGGAAGYVQWAQELLALDKSPVVATSATQAVASPTPVPETPRPKSSATPEPMAAETGNASAPPAPPVPTTAAPTRPATAAPVLTPCELVKATGVLGKGDRAMVFLQAGGETFNLKSGKELEVNTSGGKFKVRIQKADPDETVLLITDESGKEHACKY